MLDLIISDAAVRIWITVVVCCLLYQFLFISGQSIRQTQYPNTTISHVGVVHLIHYSHYGQFQFSIPTRIAHVLDAVTERCQSVKLARVYRVGDIVLGDFGGVFDRCVCTIESARRMELATRSSFDHA